MIIRTASTLRFRIVALCALLLGGTGWPGDRAPGTETPSRAAAEEALHRAVAAMGGAERLTAIRWVRVESVGATYLLEQSERPAGPWIPLVDHRIEQLDLGSGSYRRETESTSIQSPDGQRSTLLVVGDVASFLGASRSFPGSTADVVAGRERVELGPERLVLTALRSPSLRSAGTTRLQGVIHEAISFDWREGTVTVHLNASTGLPTAYDLTHAYPDDNFWGPWGDVSRRTLYSLWTLEDGVRYPRQTDVRWRGRPWRTTVVTRLDLEADLSADAPFALPEGADAAFAGRAASTRRTVDVGHAGDAIDVAPGIVLLPGWWNVTLVEVDEGIVVLEAPLSSEYGERIVAEIERRFPGRSIVGVISTSDAWPHIGGLRPWVARGVPVYLPAANVELVQELLDASYTTHPDAYERSREPLQARPVGTEPVRLGSGANRITLHAITGETSEGMLLAHFPERRIVYGADLVFEIPEGTDPSLYHPRPIGGFWMPQYLSELVDAVAREGLAVETAFAMHNAPVPWARIQRAVELAAAGDVPNR